MGSDIFLRSGNLSREGFQHGFSTRLGGCSVGAFESLNLGVSVGDDPAAVEENHLRLAAAAGLERSSFRSVEQVHGAAIHHLTDGNPIRGAVQADALLALVPGLTPGVGTADCVPILLAHPRTGRVAAVHAGWRGTEAAIASLVVARLGTLGSPAAELVAAIGPAIGRCCYEVSPELAARFAMRLGPPVAEDRHLDLPLANGLLLRAAGIPEASIETIGLCTACDADSFFSHRRDQGRSGRHLSFVQSLPVS